MSLAACDGEDDDDEDDDDEDDDHEDDDDEDRRRGPTTLMIGVGGQINITSCRQFHILGAQELAFADSCTHIAANRAAGRAARTERTIRAILPLTVLLDGRRRAPNS